MNIKLLSSILVVCAVLPPVGGEFGLYSSFERPSNHLFSLEPFDSLTNRLL